MQIHLKQLFLEEGKVVPVEGIVPNSEETLWPGHPIGSPIAISGKAANRAGIVTLDYTASFAFVSQCDRCCAPVRRQMSCRFSHLLVEELSNQGDEEGYLVLSDGVLNMDELAAEDISLELPTKVLCQDGCKGLCPKCGKNLNEGDCGCSAEDVDPRFEKLRRLLKGEG